MMNRDRAVECRRDADGQSWRLQCDPATRVCLYAPDSELDSGGRRQKPLERAARCSLAEKAIDRAALEAKGYSFVPGRPSAPYGWTRDDRGRVFQVNFDLHRRLYLGAGYSPSKSVGAPMETDRSSIDFGVFIFDHLAGRTRHRVRLVEGRVRTGPMAAELVIAHYDLSRRFIDPLLRLTTFFGEPRRHDLQLDLGMWTEGGHLEIHPTAGGDATLWRFGTAQVTLDLWQSAALDSFLRLRTGVGWERLYSDAGDRGAITGSSALELDWVLDDRGFHNLSLVASTEVPRYFEKVDGVGRTAHRHRVRAEYEAIAVAINDQPLSLVVGAGAERRNDIPGVADEWSFVASGGLRFSLWAPPRQPPR